jgi:signal transduction histidine kinase
MDADFLDALLHDLKGPISRVRILSQLLVRRTTGLDEESQQLVGHLETSASAAESVLEAVRRYADAARLPYCPRPFYLALAVDQAMARLDAQLTSSGAQVVQDALPEVHGDLGQMAVLFEELIKNALRFRSTAPPKVEIRAMQGGPDSELLVSVIDNGIGLAALDLERIFRPFTQPAPGSHPGVGLAICRRIARLHQGDITAVARPQGAEFRLRLPGPGHLPVNFR